MITMICEADAIYEDGVLKLSRKIPIRNGAKVKVIVLTTQRDMINFALELLRRGEVSVGLAARIAGMDYRAFLEEMKKHGVVFPIDKEETGWSIDTNAGG